MPRLAIFASGSGSNAENLIHFFANSSNISVSRIFCNNANAGVIERAKKLNIPVYVFSRDDFYNSPRVLNQLIEDKTDVIILAGFLWLIPQNLIAQFPNKIINIHPALLPNYGGKGMYGTRVHEAVIANNETQSGITIHLVDEVYDNGKTLFQATCDISLDDTPETLAQKVHALEYKHFPRVVAEFVSNKL
ncbi:MAG: phosphoribosylglycinamide formyltransferase [Bacteroidales bacterium]|jgi:phosphoribosylglycinamide formyltransferase-1|nr:phosphoribosylglycinamide formyltransferase [Bacteroidales bacterium]